MKFFWFFIIMIFVESCNSQQNMSTNLNLQDKTLLFFRLDDTIQFSFKLDSAYHKPVHTIYAWGPSAYYAYSNGNDTVHVLFHDFKYNTYQANDTFDYEKNVLKKVAPNNIINMHITYYDDYFRASYYEKGRVTSELNCDIVDLKDNLEIIIIYQKQKIDSAALYFFNQMCESATFKIFPKKQ